MKKITLLLILIITFSSCNEKVSNLDTYTYSFTEKSKLTISNVEGTYMNFGSIEEGENLVFEYRFEAYDEVQIADDEYAETIRFEIESQLENFNFTNAELLSTNLVFTKHCFCYFPFDELKNIEPIGVISGEKISNNEWNITINVTFYGDEQRNIQGSFILK